MDTAREAMRRVGIDPQLMFIGNLRSPKGIRKARQAVRRGAGDFDLIHAQYGSACAVSSIGHGVPTLISLRGSDWTAAYSPRLSGRTHAFLATRMTRLALRHADGVVCVSHRIASEVRTAIRDIPVCVASDPVDLDAFKSRDKTECRRTLGLDPDAKYILFTTVSKSNPLKRFELAQAAVDKARERLPHVELLVASGFPHSEMPLLAAAADSALLTSVAEGWPNCIKEALACNVPFVATDVSDLKQIADADSRCRVVDATPQALGDALIRVLTDTRTRDGLSDHLANMSFEVYARQLRDFYQEVLEQTRG